MICKKLIIDGREVVICGNTSVEVVADVIELKPIIFPPKPPPSAPVIE